MINPHAIPLCGHPEHLDRRGNSILDKGGDVVLYHACDGSQHLFRDGHSDGLIVTWTGDGKWTLTRERYARTEAGGVESWSLAPDPLPICAGEPAGRNEYVAWHLPSGRVNLRHDTQFGLLARAARFYLRREG